jgi:GNAT superfamily N-acetyltransferase
MGLQGDLPQRLGSAREEPPTSSGLPRAFRWVPIRSLSERHRPRIRAHLLALDEADRYLRFGYPASDNQIGTYVDRIDFARDEVFGIFNRRLELIAMAHLAYFGESSGGGPSVEFGASVLPRARGRGYGSRLFDHAVLHARNRGIDKLVIHALSENAAMLKIARNAGAAVQRSGPEAEAHLQLPPEDLVSNLGELVEERAAELDYQLKVQAKRVDDWVNAISEVKSRMGGKNVASE